ncbi:hypothetical protein [Mesorhizobium sp. 131-2-1]|uniref:hypothetical protein n=1 Tax=Mesorhizobium sp. 131-2-1 TaxID=2744518 RepID=UPI00192659AF|nr:hypothetical protein [Mesorhizobium sp. 131-2-1]BCG96792.1 hypothetical protein MesoLj131a_56560 [Mesorhizobium sp. 131-2-1]
MAEEAKRPKPTPEQVRALASETGVSETQIRDIISMVGLDRPSILREARVLKKEKE